MPSRSPCRPSSTARSPALPGAGIATMVEKPLAGIARRGRAARRAGPRQRRRPPGRPHRAVQPGPARPSTSLPLRPKYITAERLSTYTFRSTDIGVVLDLMIHDLDLILSLIAAPVRSVAAVGVSLFGGHEDVANARIEFEDGCVANLTASRASYAAARKMRIWGAEGYASLDFAARQATLIRPSEQLRRGPARPRRRRPEPAVGDQGPSLRQDPPRRPGPDRGREPLAAGARGLRRARPAASRVPASAARMPCAPSAWPTRSSAASRAINGTAKPPRPWPPRRRPRPARPSRVPMPGGSRASVILPTARDIKALHRRDPAAALVSRSRLGLN